MKNLKNQYVLTLFENRLIMIPNESQHVVRQGVFYKIVFFRKCLYFF